MMAMFSDCPGCMSGDHAKHVEHWGVRPEGVIDGDFCRCSGDCAERNQREFDKFFGILVDEMVAGEVLSPEASRLFADLKSDDPATRNGAVRDINRLMDEDPIVGGQ